MQSHRRRLEEELLIELHPALRIDISFHQPAPHAIGIELVIPRRVQTIGEIHTRAVATDLDHLWTAVEWLSGLRRMRGATDNAADAERAGLPWIEGIGHVVLDELARPPARHVQEAIVEREIDIGDEWRNCLESLKQRRQMCRVGGLGRNLDHFLDRKLPLPVVTSLAIPHPDR